VRSSLDCDSELIGLEGAKTARKLGLCSLNPLKVLPRILLESQLACVQLAAGKEMAFYKDNEARPHIVDTLIRGASSKHINTVLASLDTLLSFEPLRRSELERLRSLTSHPNQAVRLKAIGVWSKHIRP
jgi:hypothetical protein